MPRNLAEAIARDGRHSWWSTLPGIVRTLAEDWSLEVGAPFQPGGDTAWVAPARDSSGAELVLKLAWRHPESEHEADGLLTWGGNGAVRLHASQRFEETDALLMERCLPGSPLRDRPEPEQDVVIAGVLQRLWVEPERDHCFEHLAVMCEQWASRFEAKHPAGGPQLDAGTRTGRDRPVSRPPEDGGVRGLALHRPSRRQCLESGTGAMAGDRSQALRR